MKNYHFFLVVSHLAGTEGHLLKMVDTNSANFSQNFPKVPPKSIDGPLERSAFFVAPTFDALGPKTGAKLAQVKWPRGQIAASTVNQSQIALFVRPV